MATSKRAPTSISRITTRISRRRFLQSAGAFAGAVMIVRPQLKPAKSGGPLVSSPDRMAVLTDLTACIGCRACETACNRVNNLPPPEVPFSDTEVFETERRPTVNAFTVVNRYPGQNGSGPIYRKVQCMHCNEPACVSACPVAAMVKTPEGPVIWDERVCIGCRYCMVACPFSMPAYEYSSAFTPRVRKCILCKERVLKQGGVPACVEACPTKASIFGKREDLLLIARQRIAQNPDKYVNSIYGEHEAGGTSWLYLSSVSFGQLGFPAVRNEQYGNLAWEYLTSIPVVDILLPLAFIGLYRLIRRREQLVVEEERKKSTRQSVKEDGK